MESIEDKPKEITLPAARRVGFVISVIHGIGQIANSVKAILFGIFTLYFYTTVMGLTGTLVGIAIAVGLVWDAIIDPVIGTMSDKAQGWFGKRHGFMLVGAIGMGYSFWAYFSPPGNLSTEALFCWLLVTNILVRTMTSIFAIPYLALGAELSQDYHERTSITAIRGILALLGTIATAALSFIMFFPSSSQGVDPKLSVEGYHTMGLFAGLAMTITALISTFGTLSYRQYSSHGEVSPMLDSVKHFFSNNLLALRNPSFRSIFISYSVFFLGTVINATLSIHFLTYFMKITESKALGTFQFSFFLGALVGAVCWLRISKNIEKHRLYFTGTLCTSLVMGCAFLLLGEGHLLGIGNLRPLLFGHGLAGFFASTLWIIPASMIADVADQDELSTGQRREGIFFGLFNFGEQIAAGAAILITGILIDWFAGLIPGQAHQSAMTVTRIGMLYSLLPSALLAVAALLILPYSLDQNKVEAIQSQLNKNRGPGNRGDKDIV